MRYILLVCSVVFVLTNCRTPGESSEPEAGAQISQTRVDRLAGAYRELAGGRFAIIADFEQPSHMELFHVSAESDRAGCVFDARKGRRQTGTGCVRLTVTGPDDALIIDNRNADEWYLQRDWRPYDLLLFSVWSPRLGVAIELTIGSGAGGQRFEAATEIRLDRGWNVVRLDLAEVGEHVSMDDIRDVRLIIRADSYPIALTLDDVVLTGFREALFGDPSNSDGALYVQRAGRRWNVGAGGRFELTFANGQIVRWYDLAADPLRLRDLVHQTSLGPIPVVVTQSQDKVSVDVAGSHPAGQKFIGRQELVEATPVRIVVRCVWRERPAGAGADSGRLLHQWTYTIYPTGQIYVDVTTESRTPSGAGRSPGLAVSLSSLPKYTTRTSGPDAPGGAHAVARSTDAEGPLVLFSAFFNGRAARIVEQNAPPDRRLTLVAVGEGGDAKTASWQCHLLLTSAGRASPHEAIQRAESYAHPPGLTFTLGGPAGETVGSGAFDRGSGAYRIQPDEGRARFTLGSAQTPSHTPVFVILDGSNRDAWVYVDDMIWSTIARDSAGNLLFQLPSASEKDVRIEVLFRRQRTDGGA